MKKRLMALLMCFVVVLLYVNQFTVKTYALTGVEESVAAYLVYGMVATGVVFVTSGAADQAVAAMWEGWTQAQKDAAVLAAHAGHLVTDISTGACKYVVDVTDDVWSSVKSWVDTTYDVGANGVSVTTLETVPIPNGIVTKTLVPGDAYVYKNDGGFYRIALEQSGSYQHVYVYDQNEALVSSYTANVWQWWQLATYGPDTGSNANKAIIGYGHSASGGIYGNFLVMNTVVGTGEYQTGVVDSGVIGSEGAVDNPTWDFPDTNEDREVTAWPSVDSYGRPLIGTDGNVSLDYPRTLDDVVGKTYDDVFDQDRDGVPYVGDVAIDESTSVEWPSAITGDAAGEVDDSEINTPNMRALFFSKFPFCLPWDLMAAFSLLEAEPEAPRFTVDLVPQSMKDEIGIKTSTAFEVNMDNFELLGKMSRWFTLIEFSIGLILITRNIIKS